MGWMPSNEALSLAGRNTKKGASILLGKLPLIIRFANGRNILVTLIRREMRYGIILGLGAREKTLNLLF